MKKVIGGKLYDTEKSTLLYTDKATQRRYYATENSNYFTFYKNGVIVPKAKEDMMDLLGDLDYEAYVKAFGEPEEA